MLKDKDRDLTTEELLKKLMENFGEDEPEEAGYQQLSVDDAAKDRSAENKKYHYRVGGKSRDEEKEEQTKQDDSFKSELEDRIRSAEKYVESMNASGRTVEEEPEEEAEEDELPEDCLTEEERQSAEEDDYYSPYITAFSEEEKAKEPEEAEGDTATEEPDDAEEMYRTEEMPETEETMPDILDEQPVVQREEQSSEQEKTEQSAEDIDRKDVDLMFIFGMDQELAEKVGDKQVGEYRKEIEGDSKAEGVEEEYESPEQNIRFFKRFRKLYNLLTLRAVLAFLALILVAVAEIGMARGANVASAFGEGAAEFVSHPLYAALISLQTTMILAAIGYREVLSGFKAIGAGRAAPEVFTALTVLLSVVYGCGLVYCHSVNAVFFNLPVALVILASILSGRSNVKRKLFAFKIISTRKRKFAITKIKGGESSLEQQAFGDAISDRSGVYGVEKTNFISGFGSRTAREPRYKGAMGILAAAVVVIGLIFSLLGYYFVPEALQDNRMLSAFMTAMLSVLFCMPVSAFITYSLPFFKASRRAYKRNSAIVGEYSLEEYSDATVISFDDKEVFPSKNVKVRSIKLFADSRIDHVIFGAASVFHRLGGPLDEVFDVATGETGYTEEVDIMEIEKDGVEAAVKGVRVCVGSSGFMRGRGLLPSVEPEDAAIEMEGNISIMYVAIKDELSAKMYVEYQADEEIQSIMKSLYKAGMCIGIRTLDPNIDDRMMRNHVDLSDYPVKVLRMDGTEKERCEERISSGVVSKGSVKDLLKTLTSCRKVLQVIRINTALKILGVAAGIGVSALVLFMAYTGKISSVGEINSLWITLYQICWMLPAALISLIFA